MREVQGLRPAAGAMPAAAQPAWGNPQRFLVAGLAVFLLAAIAAIILYRQLPPRLAGLPSPEEGRELVKGLPPVDTIRFFRTRIKPGIEIREPPEFQRRRSRVYLGLAATAVVGTIGLILVTVGVAGVIRRRR
jgi:hypothetical protein